MGDGHAKLFKDAFHALSLGTVGFALFGEAEMGWVTPLYLLVGVFAHIIAHMAVGYGKRSVIGERS